MININNYIHINKILTLPSKTDHCINRRLLLTLRSVEDALFCADISLPFAEFRFKEKIIN
jgi:hypothetical protein